MIKPWSTKEVAQAHGYLDLSPADIPHHVNFADWLSKQTEFPKTVVDIGCCSGRVLDSIGGVVDKYLGLDFSEASVEFANANRATPSYKFMCMDVDTAQMPFDSGEYSICYIDSVLTMVQSPTRLLFKLAPHVDCIFLNRTPISLQTYKHSMVWGGMTTESVLWSFSTDYFMAIAAEIGFHTVEIAADQKIIILRKIGKE